MPVLVEKPAWYARISPANTIPMLLVDGRPLYEATQITRYIDDKHGSVLTPRDPLQRATIGEAEGG